MFSLKIFKTTGLIALGIICTNIVTGTGHFAMAQSIPFVTDVDRTPTDYIYKPIAYKGLKITPALSLRTSYNNNIFAQDTNEESDYILGILPSLKVEKKYGTSTISLDMHGNLERYKEFSNENRNNYLLTFNYKNQPNQKWQYGLRAGYQKQSRNRENPTGLGASENPLYYDVLTTGAQVTRTFNRLSITFLGEYDRIENEDGVSASDSDTPVIYSINDRNQYSGGLTFLYDLRPGGDVGALPERAVYLKTALAHDDYDETPNLQLSRNRTSFSALAGFIGYFSKLSLSTDIGIGYMGQQFEEESIDPTHNFDLYARIKYQPTEKHTLSFKADRDVNQNNVFIEGITQTNFSLDSDYEVFHNTYLYSGIGYGLNEYDSGREDQDLGGTLRLRYLMSPRLQGSVSLQHTKRDSTIPTEEFDRSVFMLQLQSKL